MFRLRPDATFTLKGEALSPKMSHWEDSPPPSLALDFVPDCPGPVVCVGNQHDSGGAILSGSINLEVFEHTTISRLTAHVSLTERYFEAAIHGCDECASKKIIIHDTDVLEPGDHPVDAGLHNYPVSFHIPGNLAVSYHDRHRTVEYKLAIRAETPAGESIHITVPFTVARFCPRELAQRRLRGVSPCFVMDMVIPTFSFGGDKFDIQVDLRSREAYTHPPNKFWEPRVIMWEILECTQELRLPCPKHSDLFKEQRHKSLNEGKTDIFSDELNLMHHGKDLGHLKDTKRFSLPVQLRRNVVNDITTPKGFRVWHEIKIKVLYMYTKPRPVDDHGHKHDDEPGTWDVRCFGLGAKLNIGEKHEFEEMESWDEEIAPPYGNIGNAPPLYQ
ncbi:hypothetical protein Dda_4215 [Drechslerella dactyloides]|uniref:LDB19 N-terminal domain-containing protein n=1 Tax=Drechslerella dactyloides TaxID=74499 RepID=A0AAD6IZE4_DREDA|nr:hypothetical protein Dda_4215 [Drechslerella dactyloides]